MGGITLRLALVGLVGSARGFELSEPLAGLACDSDADGESLELGHRQLDVSTPNWLQAGKELCAEECEQIAGCTTFHVMQSNGCIDEVGPDVCVPWAECTFFSRCEALEKSDEDWMDYSTSTAYFLTDRTAAPAVPSTGDRRQMYAGQNGEEVCENKGAVTSVHGEEHVVGEEEDSDGVEEEEDSDGVEEEEDSVEEEDEEIASIDTTSVQQDEEDDPLGVTKSAPFLTAEEVIAVSVKAAARWNEGLSSSERALYDLLTKVRAHGVFEGAIDFHICSTF